MELRQLRFFLCVARLRNISKAAKELHVAQPALSRQIRHLEEELGVVLFNRGVRGVELTADGQRLVGLASDLAQRADSLFDEFNPRQEAAEQNISIALPEGLARGLFPIMANRYAAMYPGGRLNIKVGISDSIREWIESSYVDLGVVYGFEDNGGQRFSSDVLIQDPLSVVAAADYRSGSLPADGQPFDFRRLARHPLVLGSPANAVRRALDSAASEAGFRLKPQFEVDSFSMLLEFVRQKRGVTVFTSTGISVDIGSGRLKAWPLTGPVLTVGISIVWLKARALSRPLKRLIRMLKEEHAQYLRGLS